MRDILFVTVDSLRADHVKGLGYDPETTPNLDELASESYVFEQAFAHAQATRISFPAIMTGSTPLMYGGVDHIIEERTLISEVLDEGGYQTGGFHSNLFLSEEFGYARGYDTFYDSKTDPSLVARLRDGVRRNLDQDGIVYKVLKWAFDQTEKHAGVELGSLYTTAEDLTDMVVDWLAETSDEPTFCWTHYMDVHHPYVPPANHQRAFREEPIGDRRAIQLRRKMLEEPESITGEELQDLIDLYDAEIRFTDAEIGRLVEHARTHMDDPVIIVTADHGEQFREHGAFSHGTVHEEGIHVPLVVHDGKGSGRYDDLVGLVDVAPTIADYADQPSPENFQGDSLRQLTEDGKFPRTELIGEWGEYPEEYYYFYRDEEWKYICNEEGTALYHLPDDPEEQTDVQERHPEVVDHIETHIADHKEKIEATSRDVETVDMDDEVVNRLEQLGYKME